MNLQQHIKKKTPIRKKKKSSILIDKKSLYYDDMIMLAAEEVSVINRINAKFFQYEEQGYPAELSNVSDAVFQALA